MDKISWKANYTNKTASGQFKTGLKLKATTVVKNRTDFAMYFLFHFQNFVKLQLPLNQKLSDISVENYDNCHNSFFRSDPNLFQKAINIMSEMISTLVGICDKCQWGRCRMFKCPIFCTKARIRLRINFQVIIALAIFKFLSQP